MAFDAIPGVLRRWAKRQRDRLRRAFDVGGHQNHGGERWAPLEESTGETPLKESSRLKEGTFTRVSGTSVLIGNRVPYAVYHQNGTSEIPRRPLVVVTRQDLAELQKELRVDLERVD